MNALSILFPGVWVHEASHAAACMVGNVKVHKVIVKSNSGMVVHDRSSVRNALLIGLAPLIIGSVLGFVLLGMAKHAGFDNPWSGLVIGWLGFSIVFHSIPSHQDMQNIPEAVGRRWGELWRSERGIATKLAKSLVYGVAGVLGLLLVGIGILVNASLVFRLAWGAGLALLA